MQITVVEKIKPHILCLITLFEIRAVILFKYECGLNFLDGFSKNTQMSNFMKIRQVGAKLFRADRRNGRADRPTKLIFVFRNFANSPKMDSHSKRR